jgi:prepilin-type N-terminal cleavage/methylation domain-containing protein
MVKGFSLLEVLLALTLTCIVSTAAFELFHRNELLFQQQNRALEMQQNLRAVLFQINDEIRRAGQGVPVYAARFDANPGEAVAVVLSGSDAAHLRIREGYSSVEGAVSSGAEYTLGITRAVTVDDATAFTAALGATPPRGRFVYAWGVGAASCWSWLRAELLAVHAASNSLTLTPRQLGDNCRVAADRLRFTAPHTLSLEEAVSLHLENGGIWRAVATDTTVAAAPVWGPLSELGRNFASLRFTYYDAAGSGLDLASLASRAAVVRIDVSVLSQDGESLEHRGYPRNLRIR